MSTFPSSALFESLSPSTARGFEALQNCSAMSWRNYLGRNSERYISEARVGTCTICLRLSIAFRSSTSPKVVECFGRYLEHEGHHVSRAEFEESMSGKMRNPAFHGDIEPLLAPASVQADAFERGTSPYNPEAAYRSVHEALIARLPGEPWKGQP